MLCESHRSKSPTSSNSRFLAVKAECHCQVTYSGAVRLFDRKLGDPCQGVPTYTTASIKLSSVVYCSQMCFLHASIHRRAFLVHSARIEHSLEPFKQTYCNGIPVSV